jgi:sigma-E factor negative regulatory protein RseA
MERLSTLMDGELDAHQAGQELTRLKSDTEARASWETYHLIGDAMRGDGVLSPQFSARLHEQLAAEPTVLAPRRIPPRRVATYAWSAAASFSAVALVGWMAFYSPLSPQPQQQLATAPQAVPVPATPVSVELANVPSEGRMNEYLIAHQEFSPSTAIQGVAPYIRSVSATQSPKGRE